MTAHADVFAYIMQNAGCTQKQTLMLTHAVSLGNFIENNQRQTLHLLGMLLVIQITAADGMEKADKLLLQLLAHHRIRFIADMQQLDTVDKAVCRNNNFLGGNQMQQLFIKQHRRQHKLRNIFRQLIYLNKLRQAHLTHAVEKGMEIRCLDAMHLLLLIQPQHTQQKLRFCTGQHQITHLAVTQLVSYRTDCTAEKFRQRLVKMHAFTAVALKAFLNTDDTDVEISLIADFFIAHQRYTQTTGGNIHHQHAFTFGRNFFCLQRITDGYKFCINLLRHINNIDHKTGFVINLIQQKNLIAGLTHSSCCLHNIFLDPVFLHQTLEADKNFADFRNQRKRNYFIFKSCLTQADTSVAALDNLIPFGIVIFGNLHTEHLRA